MQDEVKARAMCRIKLRAKGAFAVSLVANICTLFFSASERICHHYRYPNGILFQLISGLGNGGLLNHSYEATLGPSSTYFSGFPTALQLMSVAIGLSIGRRLTVPVVHHIPSGRRGSGYSVCSLIDLE